MTVLKIGSTGPAVTAAQEALNRNGASLVVDGDFGPATRDATKFFQAERGILADGEIGDETSAALGIVQAPAAPSGKCKVIDVSRWENKADYSKTWTGTDYAGSIAKATQALNILDPTLDYHEKGAKDHGKPFGTFHFVDWLENGAAQARFYWSKAKGKSGLFFADAEWGNKKKTLGNDGAAILKDFLEELSQISGKLPGIYTNRYFFLDADDLSPFAKYPCWLNDFSVRPPAVPKAPAPWTSLFGHQYQYAPDQNQSDIETVPGIGKIDVSWIYMSAEDFAKACQP